MADGTYATDYGGTGTTTSGYFGDGYGWTSSTPDDPKAARAYLDMINKGGRWQGGPGAGADAGGADTFDAVSAGLSGPQRDAAVALTALFKSYGLESLAPRILDFIKKGYSADTVSVMLQETPEYRQRFKANDARVKAGMSVLSPAEYIATERAYRDIMQSAGLPKGFYDQTEDFTKFLSGDVSPTELKSRVDAASAVVNRADPNTLNYFKQFYSTGDIIAYALDQNRAAPLIEQQLRAASIAGQALNQQVGIDQTTAERLSAMGITTDQAQQGFGVVGAEQPTINKLNSIYGADVTQQDLVNEVFAGNAQATEKRRRLASQERAAFSGSGGQSSGSLKTSDAGGY